MSARETDARRRVEQYVQRQKAYIPTYTSERLVDQRTGTPPRSDAFGFGTPVLRPRVPVKKTAQLTPKAGPGTSRAHEVESPHREATQNATPPKPRPKRQQDPDSERAARLADRRARKRKKRTIVNPPRNRDDESDTVPTADPKKGGNKVKKPAALALLYGFSATNVTKGRLTLKPTPSLGVFSKGRASAKKKVAAASMFSETEFLNKTHERAVGRSKIDVDSHNNSVSSISKPRGRATDCTREDWGENAPKPPQAPTPPMAESEVWDIELQSKLPSSAPSEPGANDSAPIVLDPRETTWSASLGMAAGHNSSQERTRSLSVMHHSEVCAPPARLDLHDELGIPHAEDAISIHPSHSVSQVGHKAADAQPPEQRPMTSKYFTAPTPVSAQGRATISMPTSRSNDGFDVCDHRTPDQDIQCTAPHVRGVVSPILSVSSAAQPMQGFQTWYDVAPLVFSSDCASDDDYYVRAHVPLEPLGVGGGYFAASVVEQSTGARAHEHDAYDPQQGALYSMSTESGDGDVGTEYFEGTFDPLATEYEDDLDELDVYDPGEEWYQNCALCEDESKCGDEEGMPRFLEGRALLLGVPEWSGNEVLSGLAQAEMDVARRLGDHWRPQRL